MTPRQLASDPLADPVFAERYRAMQARDARFDGQFITGVHSTGIYCRPSCPAVSPKPRNVTFYLTAAAAHEAGLRACKRCLPDAVPGSPEWDLRDDLAARAMRLITDGVVEREGVPGLAARLGYTPRHLTRVLTAELGAGPLALARAHRAQVARSLLTTTDLPVADVAYASGFGSIRQFNDTIRTVYERSPLELRAAGRRAGRHDDAGRHDGTGRYDDAGRHETARERGTVRLRIPARAPFDAAGVFAWLAARAVDRVEIADATRYQRTLRLPSGPALITIEADGDGLEVEAQLTSLVDLPPLVARVRRLFDLDADAVAIDAVLAADPRLAPSVAATPGVRLPGALDPHELVFRALIGQQVSVAAARTALSRLTAELGEPMPLGAARTRATGTEAPHAEPTGIEALRAMESPAEAALREALGDTMPGSTAPNGSARPGSGRRRTVTRGTAPRGTASRGTAPRGKVRPDSSGSPGPADLLLFPTAAAIAADGERVLRGPAARIRTIVDVAYRLDSGELVVAPERSREELHADLMAIPGIGPWTAGYLAMRVTRAPDVLLVSDLALRNGAARLGIPPEPSTLSQEGRRWAPWRSYASMHLWRAAAQPRTAEI